MIVMACEADLFEVHPPSVQNVDRVRVTLEYCAPGLMEGDCPRCQ